jgi:hypothetical protein
MRVRWIVLATVVLPFLAAGGTYLAGERVEVVVLRTFDGHGTPHAT